MKYMAGQKFIAVGDNLCLTCARFMHITDAMMT